MNMNDEKANIKVNSARNEQSPPVPHLKKKFNFWTALGIAICTSGAWEGWVAALAQGINGGGPVGLVWGWVFVSVGVTFVGLSLAELASKWPHSGGQYVWVAELAPKNMRCFLSWTTAWFSICGLWLGAISCALGVGVQVQSYAMIANPTYEPMRWHVFLIVVACLVIWALFNVFYVKGLHYMNYAVMYYHVTFYVVNIVVLLACTRQKNSAKYVFTEFQNSTGWDSDGISWCVGLLSALFAFFSLDTTVHFSEEIENPSIAVPRAMAWQVVLNSLMTFPFVIATVYCMGNVNELMTSPISLLSPFTQIVLNSTGNVGAAIFLGLSTTMIAFTAGFDLWGAAARSVWSLARDGALPSIFARVHPRFEVPVESLLVLLPPGILISMIYIWNSTAFYGVMAVVLVAFQMSYVLPIGLNAFYIRTKGNHVPGPWNLGRLGWFVDIVAFCFATFMVLFMSFPVYKPVTAENMNYSVLIMGTACLFAVGVWFGYARHRYNGPILETVGVETPVAGSDFADNEVKAV